MSDLIASARSRPRLAKLAAFICLLFISAAIFAIIGNIVIFPAQAPESAGPSSLFQMVKIAPLLTSPPLPPQKAMVPSLPVSDSGGSAETALLSPIMVPSKAAFALAKVPTADELVKGLRLPASASGDGSSTSSRNGNGSGAGGGERSDDIGPGIDRDMVVHLDLNTWWLFDQKQPDGDLTASMDWLGPNAAEQKQAWRSSSNAQEIKSYCQHFDEAVRSYLKSQFTTVTEFNADVSECGFTMTYHPDIDETDNSPQLRQRVMGYYRQDTSEGFNPKIRIYGYAHDVYATAYAAIGAFSEPDVLAKPDLWYGPFGVAHGTPSGQPDVLVIATPGYRWPNLEATQDLIAELKKRHIKLILLTGEVRRPLFDGNGPPPTLRTYARESGGCYGQVVFNGVEDTIGKIEIPAPIGYVYDAWLNQSVYHGWYPVFAGPGQ